MGPTRQRVERREVVGSFWTYENTKDSGRSKGIKDGSNGIKDIQNGTIQTNIEL
jgi:hypothetical protein